MLRAFSLTTQNESTNTSRHRFPQFRITHSPASVATPEGVTSYYAGVWAKGT
ncbi:hypothetical protein AmDm5_0726 [Acetobacter malorum]|uniref:Uncharacterized protein n=1 Tax=Acetobacter malorum TaxID=178901 RepID=A0A087PTS5_9PROT|nr:hypothetical protein [Acetobacter malorum]KFL90778.1 hypothetical protein AmDm5_0726 [Acetobacter malorum]OAG78047.1 hypothetical protein Amal_00663 [Acetobacter malorum]